MKLSVVMTVHNGERHLAEALDGILGQSLEDFELLIVDDASTDGTSATLAQYQSWDSRIRVLRNEMCLGPYPSANRALVEARGHAIARHDADDISPSDRFKVQWNALTSSDGVTLVTGWHERFAAEMEFKSEIVHAESWQPALEWDLLFSNAVGGGGYAMFPRVIDGTPMVYSGRHRYAEDYELLGRLATGGRVVSPETVVYRYRQHSGSITRSHKPDQDACVSEIRYTHQSRYLQGTVSRTQVNDLARFWLRDGGEPLRSSMPAIRRTLAELRAGFLDDISRRHGAAARSTLDTHIESEFQERIGYWLVRSAKFCDGSACRALLRAAIDGNALRTCRSALQYGGLAVRNKFS